MLKKTAFAALTTVYLLSASPVMLIAEEAAEKNEFTEKKLELITGEVKNALPPKSPSTNYAPKSEEVKEETSCALITAEKGGSVVLGEARILIPAGALDADTKISITGLRETQSTGERLSNTTSKAACYRFLPAGTKFKKEVLVTLPYNPMLEEKPAVLDTMLTYYYDTEANCWTPLERRSIDRTNHTLTSATTHFTDMINAVLTLPETASPVDVNLNSIKQLEAVNPAQSVIRMDAPTASPSGEASFSLPLEIPGGRRGMNPSVALVYSSSRSSGITGRGFSISCGGEVSTDTRKGLPQYNGHDSYLLNGTRMELDREAGGIQEYSTLRETLAQKIVRHYSDKEDWWEVTDGNGNVSRYGKYVDHAKESLSLPITMGSGGAYTWHLAEQCDAYGNCILYEYKTDKGYVYLKKITYTGMKGKRGNYTVLFNYEGEKESDESRKDVRVDARSGVVVECQWRLSDIKLAYKDEPLRKYSFDYKYDEADLSYLTAFTVHDSEEKESYSYTFDYEEIKDGKYFAAAEEFSVDAPLSAGLGEGSSSSYNAGGGVGVGSESHDAHISAGVQGSSSKTTTYTEVLYADMDGDSIPDLIRANGNEIHIKGSTGAERTVSINGKMNEEESRSYSEGWNLYGGTGINKTETTPISASEGASYSSTNQSGSSKTHRTFADLDGDGLADIVESNSTKYLKNLGNIEFEERNIYAADGVKVEEATIKLTDAEKDKYNNIFSPQRPFRMWKAPYEGSISVTQSAEPYGSFDWERNVCLLTYDDSEKKCDEFLLSKNAVNKQLKEYSVGRGGHLYFISRSDDVKNTALRHNIKIKYTKVRAFDSLYPLPVAIKEKKKNGMEVINYIDSCYTPDEIMAMAKRIPEPQPNANATAKDGAAENTTALEKFCNSFEYDATLQKIVRKDDAKNGLKFDKDFYEAYIKDNDNIDSTEAVLEKYTKFGITPSYEEPKFVYKSSRDRINLPQADANKTGNELCIDTLDGEMVIVADGKVFAGADELAGVRAETKDNKIELYFPECTVSYELKSDETGKPFAADKTITYNTDCLYDVDDEGYISLICFDENGSLIHKAQKMEALAFDTASDFSNKNQVISVFVKTIQVPVSDKKNPATTKMAGLECYIEAGESLYGGIKNWYYGIWSSTSDFSPKLLTAFIEEQKELNKDKDESEFESRKDALKEKAENGNVSESDASGPDIPFYLPTENSLAAIQAEGQEGLDLSNFPLKKEGASGAGKAVLNTALIGRVNMSCSVNKKRQTETKYFTPFISGDIVHAVRAGGDSFYQIEGLFEDVASQDNGNQKHFRMPYVGRGKSEGTDVTWGCDFSVDAAGGGKTLGHNKGANSVTQTLRDMNGDGRADIVIYDGKSISVYPCVEEDGKVKYAQPYKIDGFHISESESEMDTNGASISASGGISLRWNGKRPSVVFNPSMGGGLTTGTSDGTSSQTGGLLDINGDGLADYVYEGNVLLNKGREAENYGFAKTNVNLSETKVNGSSKSFSVSKSYPHSVTCLGSGFSASGSVNISMSVSKTQSMYLDLNGDGLADYIRFVDNDNSVKVKVRYNSGNGFTDEKIVELPTWGIVDKSEIKSDVDGDLGFVGDIKIIGNAIQNFIRDYSFANKYRDVLNDADDALSLSTDFTVASNANLGGNFKVSIPILDAFININGNGSGGAGVTATENALEVSMTDLDGDGMADQVMRIPGKATFWKKNIAGKTGLLNCVHLPTGGSYTIEYKGMYGTADMPHFSYVMSSVIANDGCGVTKKEVLHGEHSVQTEYQYSNARYDRLDKEFYGFGKIVTTLADGSKSTALYSNDTGLYHTKCMPLSGELRSKDGTLLSENRTKYEPSPFALPTYEESRNYEKDSSASVCGRTEYEYDKYGNVISLTQYEGNSAYVRAKIDYAPNYEKHILSLPSRIEVEDAAGNTVALREGEYNADGSLVCLKEYSSRGDFLGTRLDYDENGNIVRLTYPTGVSTEYEYDRENKMLPVTISQVSKEGERLAGSIEYDDRMLKKGETDCNGNSFAYKYDPWLRLSEMRTPYDTGEIPAVRYEYNMHNDKKLMCAVTYQKIRTDAADESVMRTIVQCDGLGRTVRTAKQGEVRDADTGTKTKGWNVSGPVEYDIKGRTVKEYAPYFVAGEGTEAIEDLDEKKVPFEYATEHEYDERDRSTLNILPDGSEWKTGYYIEESYANPRAVVCSTDAQGNVTETKSDVRGNIVAMAKYDADGKLATHTRYEYDALGRMTLAYDAADNPVNVEYDMLGRRTLLSSVDSGYKKFYYDKSSGNLVQETDSVMDEKRLFINYEYDAFNRLVGVDYPGEMTDTVYVYGKSADRSNLAGRLAARTDASGTVSYMYGKLGETTKETRTISSHIDGFKKDQTATMEYKSDYLGRMQEIVYPDGECVEYAYDYGGNVCGVSGTTKDGNDFSYVKDIGYDEYGQRNFIEYGNGVKTEYEYNPERRWLSSIRTENENNIQYQNIEYKFDTLGNILSYTNDCLNGGAYKTSQSYTYDALGQLTSVSGSTEHNPYRASQPVHVSEYKQKFVFDEVGLGRMMNKTSSETTLTGSRNGDDLNYAIDYVYAKGFAHRLERAGNRWYKYDANGNVTQEEYDGLSESDSREVTVTDYGNDVYGVDSAWGYFETDNATTKVKQERHYRRTYVWDVRNRLTESHDSTNDVYYIYGEDGMRTNKYTRNAETIYFCNFWTWHKDGGSELDGGKNSKHIFLGTERLVTKVNSANRPTDSEEMHSQYFYHSDHLGSAQLVTNQDGEVYQRIEYTPYGETWIDMRTNITALYDVPYRFTAKELDKETGLYYYGARYLDPKYSRWISTDPALGEYIPAAGKANAKDMANLPGMGGIFNHTNAGLFHYAGNCPVRYIDPDGRWTFSIGLGLGLAGKVKIGHNDGKWELEWRLGVGYGGNLSVDLNDESFTQENSKQLGFYAEAEISGEIGDYGLGLDSQVGVEGVVNDDGTCYIDCPNNATGSITYQGLTGEISVDKGQFEISPIAPESSIEPSLGVNGMGFVGFGGCGVLKEDK